MPRIAKVASTLSPVEQQQLVVANRPLVFKIAGELRRSGPSYDDLVQEGCVGLCIAARKYDPTRENKFSTYAAHWIRACMMAFAINTRGPVRFGSTKHQRRIYFNLGRVRRKLEAEGETATPEKIAAVLNVPLDQVIDALPRMANKDWSVDARYDDGAKNLRSVLVDKHVRADDLLEAVRADAEASARLRKAVASLKPRSAFVVKMRFLREDPLTLQEVGDRLAISRERVRQLEARALKMLRAIMVPA